MQQIKNLIALSPLAIDKLKEVMSEEGEESAALRISVLPSGGGGVQYMLSLEPEPTEDDLLIEGYDIRVIVDEDSAPLVEGAEIDYVEGLMRSGFVINNPNLPQGGGGGGCGGNCACGGNCGCGSSH